MNCAPFPADVNSYQILRRAGAPEDHARRLARAVDNLGLEIFQHEGNGRIQAVNSVALAGKRRHWHRRERRRCGRRRAHRPRAVAAVVVVAPRDAGVRQGAKVARERREELAARAERGVVPDPGPARRARQDAAGRLRAVRERVPRRAARVGARHRAPGHRDEGQVALVRPEERVGPLVQVRAEPVVRELVGGRRAAGALARADAAREVRGRDRARLPPGERERGAAPVGRRGAVVVESVGAGAARPGAGREPRVDGEARFHEAVRRPRARAVGTLARYLRGHEREARVAGDENLGVDEEKKRDEGVEFQRGAGDVRVAAAVRVRGRHGEDAGAESRAGPLDRGRVRGHEHGRRRHARRRSEARGGVRGPAEVREAEVLRRLPRVEPLLRQRAADVERVLAERRPDVDGGVAPRLAQRVPAAVEFGPQRRRPREERVESAVRVVGPAIHLVEAGRGPEVADGVAHGTGLRVRGRQLAPKQRPELRPASPGGARRARRAAEEAEEAEEEAPARRRGLGRVPSERDPAVAVRERLQRPGRRGSRVARRVPRHGRRRDGAPETGETLEVDPQHRVDAVRHLRCVVQRHEPVPDRRVRLDAHARPAARGRARGNVPPRRGARRAVPVPGREGRRIGHDEYDGSHKRDSGRRAAREPVCTILC